MIYKDIRPGVFLERLNRFVARVEVDGHVEVCHVKNTGRLKELLIPGTCAFVQRARNPERKTKYDLISVYRGDQVVNIDSAAPNALFREWVEGSGFFGELMAIKPERRFGNSRFDFYLEAGGDKVFVEVKGVTLNVEGVARFPDAPTERGVKHLRELAECADAGYRAAVAFIIQMKGVTAFAPNDETHTEFGQALREATVRGVEVLALDCHVTEDSIFVDQPVKINLA